MSETKLKPSILIATGLYPPESGGPATFAKLAEEELSKRGFVIEVVPFSRARKYPKIIRHFVYALMLFKRSRKHTIIFALDPVSVGLPARLVALLSFKKFIVRPGGDYAWEQGKQRFGVTCRLDDFYLEKKLPWKLRVLQNIQAFVLRGADKIIVPSEYLKSIISRCGGKNENIEVVYSVSYLHQFENGEEIKKETGPVLVSISRLVPWKGFLTLIDVVNKLREKYPDIILYIGGDGPQQKEIADKIVALSMSRHVKLLGLLERKEISALSKKTDVFVLNTQYEGFSHLLVEFMAFGVPIVTTNVGGNPELITHRDSGLLVEYDNVEALKGAVEEMLNDADQAKKFVEAAKKRVGEFSQEKSVQRLDEILSGIVE